MSQGIQQLEIWKHILKHVKVNVPTWRSIDEWSASRSDHFADRGLLRCCQPCPCPILCKREC